MCQSFEEPASDTSSSEAGPFFYDHIPPQDDSAGSYSESDSPPPVLEHPAHRVREKPDIMPTMMRCGEIYTGCTGLMRKEVLQAPFSPPPGHPKPLCQDVVSLRSFSCAQNQGMWWPPIARAWVQSTMLCRVLRAVRVSPPSWEAGPLLLDRDRVRRDQLLREGQFGAFPVEEL